MDILQRTFDMVFKDLFQSAETVEELEGLGQELPDQLKEEIEEASPAVLESIRRQAEENLKEWRRLKSDFVERNLSKWGRALDLLEVHNCVATESGALHSGKLLQGIDSNDDVLLEILTRLHARGCLRSKEIICLLENGFPDGAHARWRALHEINVTASFLLKHGPDAALLYRQHKYVESFRAARGYRKFQPRLNVEELDSDLFSDLEEQSRRALQEHGQNFKRPYGWAVPFISASANFASIEEDVDLDHWRPYYKLASYNVHAGPKSLEPLLGTPKEADILLAGPSDAGFADPAHSAAISLSQLTAWLLLYRPNLDSVVMSKVLIALSDQIGDEFVECLEKSDGESGCSNSVGG